MKTKILYLLIIIIFVASSFAILSLFQQNSKIDSRDVDGEKTLSETVSEKEVKFTQKMFDPEKVTHILPLGELNGGYEETQTVNGIMINLKKDAKGNAEPIEIYAPTDMMLENYAYAVDPRGNTAQYYLSFKISDEVRLNFDHIAWVTDEIRAVTPPTPNSGRVPALKRILVKGGDLIAKTSGTNEAHNWNIYLRDSGKKNAFVNQARYEAVREMYDYVNAACPFDYYDTKTKNQYLALMGYREAGESKNCGSNSRDVKGAISGLWHLNKEGIREEYKGEYATPFSIYKASSGEIVLYEINRRRYILNNKNKTYKDPAEVTGSHCYNLTEWPDDKITKGYAYFKVISNMEMMMSYNFSGTCPTSFPAHNAITYYR